MTEEDVHRELELLLGHPVPTAAEMREQDLRHACGFLQYQSLPRAPAVRGVMLRNGKPLLFFDDRGVVHPSYRPQPAPPITVVPWMLV